MHHPNFSSSLFRIIILILAISSIIDAQTTPAAAGPSDLPRPIDTAFDVQPASVLGGCSSAQKNDLSVAFDEMMQMKNIISVATGDMSNNAEMPATGWMFNYLFAIPSTEENMDYGDDRDNLQIDNLLKIWRKSVVGETILPLS